mmetsp:Transcript_11127/g.20828  ORF Transcript_11127/g.20828 Transcript_11127/m.20828 type:complete len:867 (-) Transcript_11127:595-3195(-)|eukprot:CAMPEP_0176497828 /NCGR_PEP_ID=MMETSP0200_2-20121128/11958_1 /TAXON_ID=947934 /ORGANISM="Chaetoceros sp., Strain GSL56" /LENGTH=866 /DNA_ID=CAMNT_0017895919 /DNA_START=417 /DNA_END=3017 /DNA_ORIENTATION=-
MTKHVLAQKEKHTSTGTTLLHNNDAIELSVSSPCSQQSSRRSPAGAAAAVKIRRGSFERTRKNSPSSFSSCSNDNNNKKKKQTNKYSNIPVSVRGLFQRKERPQSISIVSSSCKGTNDSTTDQGTHPLFRRRNSSSNKKASSSSFENNETDTVVIYPKVPKSTSAVPLASKTQSLNINIPPYSYRKVQEFNNIQSHSQRGDEQNDDSIPPCVLPVCSSSSSSDQTMFVEADTPLHSNKTILNLHSLSLTGNDSQGDINSIYTKMEEPPQETYFSLSDFTEHNWVETITSNSSTTESLSSLGFLSIMAATVVIHPMLLLTGAATAVWAVGVVHAVEKGYEFFTDGQFQNIFWADAVEETSAPVERVQGDDAFVHDNRQQQEKQQHQQEPQFSRPNPTVSQSMDDSLLPPSPIAVLPPSPPPPVTPHHSSQHRHPTSQDPSILSHFPPLEHQLVTAEFPGLNALEFFHVFFSDHAPYSWKEFQQSMGDVDIEFGSWTKLDHPPNPCTSFHPFVQLANLPHNPLPTCSQRERIQTFKTLTKSYFGPAYASAQKTQRVSKFSTRLVILESKTQLFDIPFSDRFFVLERWIIESVKHDTSCHPYSNATMKYTTRLSVSVQVFMLKPCNWEKQIRSKTLSTMTDLVTTWSEKATQALDLTLRRKLERMRVRYDSSDGKSIYSFQSQTREYKVIKSPSTGSCAARTSSSLSSLSANSRMANTYGTKVVKKLETPEEELIRIHEKRLKLLEEKIASGDLEWCSIEMKHCLSAGEGNAFARVLDQERCIPLTTSPRKNDYNNSNTTKNQNEEMNKSLKIRSSGKKSDKIFKWNFKNGTKRGLSSDNNMKSSETGEKGQDNIPKKTLVLRRKKDTA